MADGRVVIDIDANGSQAIGETEKVKKSLFGLGPAAEKSNGGFGSIVKSSALFGTVAGAAMAVVTGGINAMKSSLGGAVARFDTLNAYPKVMAQMGYSTDDVTKSVGILKKGVDGLPTSLQDLTKSAQGFAILEKSATKGAETATALNDAFLASGASAGDASRGVEQYSQMLASGTVDLQSWRTLQETMPYALTKVANSFGLTGKSAERDLYAKLKSGQITVDQLNQRFVELDGGVNGFANTARTASGGIGTSFTNMRNAVTNGLANMIKAVDNGLKSAGLGGIAEIFNKAKDVIVNSFVVINGAVEQAIPKIVDAFKKIYEVVKQVIDFVQKNSDWIMPLVVGIGAGVGAFTAITKAITLFKTAMAIASTVSALSSVLVGMATGSRAAGSALTFLAQESKLAAAAQAILNAVMAINPFVLIAAAIIAVVAVLVYFFTQTKLGQEIWSSFVAFLVSLWNSIVTTATTIFNSVMTFINNVWTSISTFATNTWNAIVSTVTGIWNGFISGATAFASGLFNGIKSIWNGISGWASGLWNGIKSAVSGIWNGFVSAAKSFASGLWNGIKGIWDGISGWASGLWNGVKSTVSNVWNGIVSTVTNLANSAINGLKGAWNGITGWVSSLWNGVKSTIQGAMHFDLGAAGRAIMSSFLGGLQAAWGAVKSFVGGIASWIKEHKGPISYDKKLLIPAGKAIMTGFGNALNDHFADVKTSVSSFAGQISDVMATGIDNNENTVVNAMSNMVDSAISAVQDADIAGSVQDAFNVSPQVSALLGGKFTAEGSIASAGGAQANAINTTNSSTQTHVQNITFGQVVWNGKDDIQKTLEDLGWQDNINRRGAMA